MVEISGSRPGVASEETDRRRSARHHQVEILLEAGYGGRGRGRRTGQRPTRLLIIARVITADRHRDEIAAIERRADGREAERSAAGEELLHLKRKPWQACGLVAVVGARAADREVELRDLQDVGQRIDIVAAAREASGRINAGRKRVYPSQAQRIPGVRIAVAEHDDAVDLLGCGGRGRYDKRNQRCARKGTRNSARFHNHDPPLGRAAARIELPAAMVAIIDTRASSDARCSAVARLTAAIRQQ